MAYSDVRFKVVGTKPLLTHNPSAMLTVQTGPKAKRIPSPQEEAEGGLYRDEEGQFCLPSVSFRSAFLTGLKGKKIGRVGAAVVLQPAVFTDDVELGPLLDPQTLKPLKEYVIDSRTAVVQRNRIVRSRPRFNKWAAVLTLRIDDEIVTTEQVCEHLNIAGVTVGVGDFRIEKRGQFGGFSAEIMEK